MSDYSNSEIPNGSYYADVAVLAKIFAKRYGISINAAYEWLTKVVEVPSADVQPVMHGEWYKPTGMMPPENTGRHRCSLCDGFAMHEWKHHREVLTHYCPNCGAKMDKRKGSE